MGCVKEVIAVITIDAGDELLKDGKYTGWYLLNFSTYFVIVTDTGEKFGKPVETREIAIEVVTEYFRNK